MQIVQKMIRDITFSIPQRSHNEIIPYMRGIIAAEACVNFNPYSGHRRVFITATDIHERLIFVACLRKLGIETKDCKPIKDIIISRKHNIQRLHDLKLMTLNPTKYRRFLEMMESYQ